MAKKPPWWRPKCSICGKRGGYCIHTSIITVNVKKRDLPFVERVPPPLRKVRTDRGLLPV
jgi:hypothetical protein